MTIRASVADVLAAHVTIQPDETIAIVQQLIAAFRSGVCDDIVEPPFGPPTPERVMLNEDGSVRCRGCDTTPAVSEIAMLLQTLLPPAPARVPGGLRYTVARALLDVDVAPFDSLDELSDTLARYERGSREQIVIGVLHRFAATRGLVPVSLVERRRHVRATELRRALREADARLYLQKIASEPLAVSAPRSLRRCSLPVAAASLAAGMLVIGGELVRHTRDDAQRAVSPPLIAAPAAAPSSDARTPSVAGPGVGADSRRAEPTPPSPVRERLAMRRAAVRSSESVSKSGATARRASRPIPRVHPQPTPRGARSEGVLDRLRLRWLRGMFAKADL